VAPKTLLQPVAATMPIERSLRPLVSSNARRRPTRWVAVAMDRSSRAPIACDTSGSSAISVPMPKIVMLKK